MVLSDRDIKQAIKDKDLVFTPKIQEEQVEAASIDLKLGPILKVFHTHKESVLDLKKHIDFNKMMDTQTLKKIKGLFYILDNLF